MKEEYKDIVTEKIWTEIEELLSPNSDEDSPKYVDIDVNTLSKDMRTGIHKMIKQVFKKKLTSLTVNIPKPEDKLIRVKRAKGEKGENRNQWTWEGDYVYFVVRKENIDTVQAATIITDGMKLRASQVNYAGTKDKRGITTQMFCIKRRYPLQIKNSLRGIRNIKIGNFHFKNEVLKLGRLSGNQFKIALRHLQGDQSEIEKSLENIREHGFINFYGLQRFGNCASIPTYEIGIAIMKADYKLATELILKPRNNDLSFLQKMRETWWKNRNSKEALGDFVLMT